MDAPAIDSIAALAWSTIMSAIGQAAVVIVRSTSTASVRDLDPIDETEVDDVHPGLGIVDLHQRVTHGVVVERRGHRIIRSISVPPSTGESGPVAVNRCRDREREPLRRREPDVVEEAQQREIARGDDRLDALDAQSRRD